MLFKLTICRVKSKQRSEKLWCLKRIVERLFMSNSINAKPPGTKHEILTLHLICILFSGLGQMDTEEYGQSDDLSGTAMVKGKHSSRPRQTPLSQMR